MSWVPPVAAARTLAAGLAAVLAVVAAGCSTAEESGVPAACRAGTAAVLRALEEAPDPVRLDGQTPISDCFARQTDQADLQTIGVAFTDAASTLARDARRDEGSDAALELGYLIGAVRRGVDQTPALYDELLRRLEGALSGVDTGSQAFRTGESAGREHG